jgi:HSP20 family protein
MKKSVASTMSEILSDMYNQAFSLSEITPSTMLNRGYLIEDGTLYVSLPGYSKNDIDIEIDGNTLTIKCNIGDEKIQKNPFRVNCTKYWTLDHAINTDNVIAKMENGILSIKIDKPTEKKKINIF